MSRRKRKSATLETARRRLAGIKQISPKPAWGDGLTEEAFEAEIDNFTKQQDAYNGEVAALDESTNLLDSNEQRLSDLSQRFLAAVKAKFGPDSNEFELAGAVRRSDRKRRSTKKVPAAA